MNRLLNNSIEIPCIGFGTDIACWWHREKGIRKFITMAKEYGEAVKRGSFRKIKIDQSLKKNLINAPKCGCFLFDTSSAYGGSEFVVGQALKIIGREKIFVTTKISNKDQISHMRMESFYNSLRNLGTDYIDLYLMHWPVEGEYIETWKFMERLYEQKKVRAIGVSNFNIHHLETLKKSAKYMPMVNQIECHPLFTQVELREYCKKNDIQIMAYTPTARMDQRMNNSEELEMICRKYNKSIAQVVLKWHIQLENIPIVNTTSYKHCKENFGVFDFDLTEEEVDVINHMNINSRLRYDPDNCNFKRL